MSLLAWATWAAAGVLVLGSTAVFLWFLKDAGGVLHGKEPSGEGARPGSVDAGHEGPRREPGESG